MKTPLKLSFRKARSYIPQLLGLILLLVVGVCFYITLSTIVLRFEETAEKYITDNAYADITFYGTFNEESVNLLLASNEIDTAQGRTVRDYREGERIFRVVSLTDGINIPYLYDGCLPSDENECVLLKRNADSMGFSIGDKLTLADKSLTITGLAASPEYIYMVQNERTMMAQTERFGVIFVQQDFFPTGFNEIVAITDSKDSVNELALLIGAFRYIPQKDQQNHLLYRSDLGEIGSFAAIFPLIFAVLITVVIYVMLSRTIQKDRKQIGTMKSLGVTDGKIIGIYLTQFGVASLIGALIGCIAAVFIGDLIIGIFSSMFEVPTLSFAFYLNLWGGAVFVSMLLCVISGLIALIPILKLLPAHAMRSRVPKSGRRILLERAQFLWKRFSFNTRYALKNSFRNKSRFFAVVLGMCGSCALLAFSLGFYDSIGNTQDKYFQDFTNYDVIISFDPVPLSYGHPAAERMPKNNKALLLNVDIMDEQYLLAVLENDFDMLNIPSSALQNGVVIPEYFAQIWNVKVGDTLRINGYDVLISAIVTQYLGLTIFTGYDYIDRITTEIPA
ncbi:MAG: ABC transporter permease, partial [Lachnospiraceae bacterium]|nr:ABC transporter permease [Lachnospiraceae bacterium]